MNALKHRPLLTLCIGFVVTVFCLYPFPVSVKWMVLFLVGMGITVLFFLRFFCRPDKKPSLLPLLPLLLGLVIGCLSSYLHFDRRIASIVNRAGESGTITAQVTDVTFQSNYTAFYTVHITELDGEAVSFKASLTIPQECDANRGDLITLYAVFSLPPENENGFPSRSYKASHGIYLDAEASADSTISIEEGNRNLFSFFYRLSDTLSARLRLILGEKAGGFAAGILLGNRDAVAEATRRDFRFLGLSHILAVSGLHLSVLVGGFLLFLRRVHVPRILRLLLCSILIVFILFLTGFPASILRAGIMMFLMLVSRTMGTQNDPPTSLALAIALILLFSPDSLLDIGFQLSASATAGLLALGNPLAAAIEKKTAQKPFPVRILGRCLSAMAITIAAISFTLPFMAYTFGELCLVSPISNLLFLPLTSVALFLIAGVLLLYATPLLSFFASITGDILGFMLSLAAKLTRYVPEPISLQYDFAVFAFLFAGITLIALFLAGKKRLVTLVVPLLVFSTVFGSSYAVYQQRNRAHDQIVTANWNRNDYLLLHTGGKTLLCDFSDGSYSSLRNAAALSATVLHDSSPDGLLLTHLHRKHVSAFARLADNHRLSHLIFPAPYDDTTRDAAEALQQEAEARDITVISYPADTTASLAFDDCQVILTPLLFLERSTQPLCTLTIQGNGTFVYLGGGITESPLREEALKQANQAELTMLGIHGPKIKAPLDATLNGTVLVSQDEVNICYGTDYDTVNSEERFYRLILFQQSS